jgi:CheY-like chemotaxis protein
MDGFRFLEELERQERAGGGAPSTPVVVMTGRDLDDEERELLAGHVEQIFDKNRHSPDELLDLLATRITASAPRAR